MTSMNDCEELRALIPAYSIGATDEQETRQIEDGMKRCPDLVTELAQYADFDAAFAGSLPPAVPPPELLGNLLAEARRTRQRRSTRGGWVIAVAVLAAVLLATNAFWLLREQTQTPTPREITLSAAEAGAESNASGRVIWTPGEEDAVLIASNFPEHAPDMAYQAWARRDGERVSLGVFQVNDYGKGTLTFPAELLEGSIEVIGVTLEPAEGSPGPTSSAVVRWRGS